MTFCNEFQIGTFAKKIGRQKMDSNSPSLTDAPPPQVVSEKKNNFWKIEITLPYQILLFRKPSWTDLLISSANPWLSVGKIGRSWPLPGRGLFYSDNNDDKVGNVGGDGGDEEDLGHLVTWPVPGHSISPCKEGSRWIFQTIYILSVSPLFSNF